ncbi:MAG: hypothetical protein H6Q60_304 [Oscillospiraceae bacterium]|nr:hypothetical protein [Oscillospiraceae bacterium]
MAYNDVIVLYLRISLEDADLGQDGKDESNSIANQRALLFDFIGQRKEFEGCTVIELCDDGYSGTNFERPGVKKMVELAKRHEISCIMVKDFSRFGRDYITVGDYVDQIFPFLGIRFISVNDGYDSNDCQGTTSGLDMSFRNIVYAYYSQDLSDKVRSGKRTKAKTGSFLSPFAPIGYRKDEKNRNHLLVEEAGAAIVGRIFELAASGMSVINITRLLNAEQVATPSQLQNKNGCYHKWWTGISEEKMWDKSKVLSILRDERYLGKNIYGKRVRPEAGHTQTKPVKQSEWIVVKGTHEPIVSEDLFRAAENKLRWYEQKDTTASKGHVFSGKIRCGNCGYALRRITKPLPKLFCGTKARKPDCGCFAEYVKESEIANAVFQILCQYVRVLLDDGMFECQAKANDRIASLQKQISAYQRGNDYFQEQKAELYDEKAAGRITKVQYQKKYHTLEAEQEGIKLQLEKRTAELSDLERRQADETPMEQSLRNCFTSEILTREMVMEFVDCVYVLHQNAIHVRWRFQKQI